MSKRRDVPGVRPYEGPAGGWGALRATADAVRHQMEIVEAPITLLRTNQPDGFDCPGCAWPDKEHRSTFQFCENGAKAVTWEATSKRVPPAFFAENTVASLLQRSDFELEGLGRLTHPLVYDRATDTFRAVEWAQAFARIGEILRGLSPHQAEFYTSGRASNEAAYIYQLFCARIRHEQLPRLLQHVPRTDERRFAAVDRHRQGHGVAGGLRPLRAHPLDRPQSRHEPSADDGNASRSLTAQRTDHRIQPAA